MTFLFSDLYDGEKDKTGQTASILSSVFIFESFYFPFSQMRTNVVVGVCGFGPLRSLLSEVTELHSFKSCNECSQQDNKAVLFQNSGSGETAALNKPNFKSLLAEKLRSEFLVCFLVPYSHGQT